LTSEEVLRLVVMPDEQERYHCDEMGYETLASIPGLSRRRAFVGRLPPREAEHYRNSLAQQEYVRTSVPAEDDGGQERLLSLSQKSVR
jgi:hypothetical protein